MSTKNLTYRIGADIGELRREMEAAGTLTRKMQRELADLEAQQHAHRQALADLGEGFVTYGAAVTAGLAVAGKAAIEWESAWTGVKKTVDGSPQEIAALEAQMRQLARTLPATHQEIAGVAEAAGQLGIKREDIAEFTRVMIDLGNTTNLTAQDAAAELAKLSNIMGTSASDVDRLGSALVALGNDGASTEADIVAMALRIAGAGRQIGLTEAQVLGFASALSSVGIEAEAGGSSISRVMISIEQAVRGGGSAVKGFADVAGMSAADFSRRYREDAAGAIATFIAGLNRMQQAGGDVFSTLEDLGFSEILVRDALLRAAGASDMLTRSLQVGSSAWVENNALAEEASKRYETSASKLQVAGNQVKDTLIDVGAAIAPIAVGAAEFVGNVVKAFQNLPGPAQEVVIWVGAATAAVTLFGGAALIAAPKVLAFRESMSAMAATGGGFATAMGRFGLLMAGPLGVALAVGATGLTLLASASGSAAKRQEELAGAGRTVAQVLRDQNGVVNESVRQAAAKEAKDKGLLSAARNLGIDLGAVTDAVLGQGRAYDDLQVKLQAIIKANTDLNGTAGAKGGQATKLNDHGKAAQDLSNNLRTVHDGLQQQVKDDQDVAEASKGAGGATKEHAAQQENLSKKAEDATKALNDLVKALDSINGVTLSYRDAQREYLDQLVDTNEALTKNGQTLDINTASGRENLAALDAQAKAANELAEAAAREAESVGGATAGQAALRNSLTASREALIETAMKFGMGREEAIRYADSVLAIPTTAATAVETPGSEAAKAELQRVRDAVHDVPPNREVNVGVLSEAAQRRLSELGFQVRTLPDGTVAVTANTAPASDRLDEWLRRPATKIVQVVYRGEVAYRTEAGTLYNARGGIVAFAGGGMYEDHRPQVARATPGTVRVWAEPETDRESYIPWAMDRRARAVDVLSTTADAFGYQLMPKSRLVAFSHGGMTGTNGLGRELATGLAITGRLRIDGDGFGTLVDARITSAISQEGREIRLRGGRP